jgi:hypothetical protein
MDGKKYSSGSTRSGTKVMNWIDLPWDRVSLQSLVNAPCTAGSVKCIGFHEKLKNSWFVRKNSTPWN